MKTSRRRAKERGLLRHHPDEVPEGETNHSIPRGGRLLAKQRFHWHHDRVCRKRAWLRRNRKRGQPRHVPRENLASIIAMAEAGQ